MSGGTFLGWGTSSSATSYVSSSKVYSSNTTLYAIWKIDSTSSGSGNDYEGTYQLIDDESPQNVLATDDYVIIAGTTSSDSMLYFMGNDFSGNYPYNYSLDPSDQLTLDGSSSIDIFKVTYNDG